VRYDRTRRELFADAAGASLAGVLLAPAGLAAAQAPGPAAPDLPTQGGWTNRDYWAFADWAMTVADDLWSDASGFYGSDIRTSAAMLADYRATLAAAARLAGEAQSKRARLDALQAQSRADREKLLAERRERRRVLDQMAGEIRQSRKEIKVLRTDAARLARLVEELAVLLPAQARKEPFSKLRGRLSLPVRGELTGRFGAPRGAAGTEAKGLFIRAPQGQPVRAIAGGQVVYAEWMRGFGNLLIVDHGEAYLSIYANNESLLKQVGDVVAAGESVATTGASGGNEETGLYFEMRHLGRAFDPLRWVKLNK